MGRGRRDNVVQGRFGGARTQQWADPKAHAAPRRKRAWRSWAAFLPLWAGAALLGTAYGAGWLGSTFGADQPETLSTAPSGSREFSFCHTGGGRNCVVDGDTLWLDGERVRIADIDAPETHDFKCASEKELGDRATRRLHDLLESGPISLQPIDRDEDRYGRKLRIVLVQGESVGKQLVGEGLARYYGNGRQPWC